MHISKTINVVQPIFFTVSLEANIPTLQISVPIINRYYQNPSFFIICPAKSFAYFANALSDYPNVQLVNEEDLISFASFKKLAQQIGNDLGLTQLSLERLGWYYQQALKLGFLLNLSQSNFRAVMWDADSIPLAQKSSLTTPIIARSSTVHEMNSTSHISKLSKIYFSCCQKNSMRQLYSFLPVHPKSDKD